jgi:hypothetical protein
LLGLIRPVIPPGGVAWTIALMGGVGGTVTVLCYGYWIREAGRQGIESLQTCRIDLATGYVMTAVFGIAMVIIGSRLEPLSGGGATLIVAIAGQLEPAFGAAGPLARWAFLLGAWGAVFSSLLGVWQSVPYLFADFWRLTQRRPGEQLPVRVDTNSLPYRACLYGIATIPAIGLILWQFQSMQKTYALVGALFIPALALALLLLNGHARIIGAQHKNSIATNLTLIAALLFFLAAGYLELRD